MQREVRRFALLPVSAVALAAVLALPTVIVALHMLLPHTDAWEHVSTYLLSGYVSNTLLLAVGTAVGVLLLGTGSAWLVATCRFPGRGFFQWALVLPLAFPGYVIAWTYADFLAVSGPVQTGLRELTGWGPRDYWFPSIRSLGGAVLMFSLVLYPYVYLLARNAFQHQAGCILEAARTLGCPPRAAFRRVALPMARPAIIAGTLLALMETLADFGTVSYFGVPVFTTGIFRAWYSMGDPVAAAKLSALLLMLVAALIVFERYNRGAMRFHVDAGAGRRPQPFELRGARAWFAFAACGLPVLLGFLLPALLLLDMAVANGAPGLRHLHLAENTVALAVLTSAIAVAAALLIAYARRLFPRPAVTLSHTAVTLGYAVPGAVIAVGVIIPLAALDNAVDGWLRATVGISSGLLLTGSIAGLVLAYLVRFLSVALQTVDAGLCKVTPSMDAAARSLGESRAGALRRVHMPMLSGSLGTAALIVFVEVMKELPATLILRPFNFDTLAVQAYNLASDERLAEAAMPALLIVAVGLVPVVLLTRRPREREEEPVPRALAPLAEGTAANP